MTLGSLHELTRLLPEHEILVIGYLRLSFQARRGLVPWMIPLGSTKTETRGLLPRLKTTTGPGLDMTQAANFKYGKNNLASLIIISFAFTIVSNYRLE